METESLESLKSISGRIGKFHLSGKIVLCHNCTSERDRQTQTKRYTNQEIISEICFCSLDCVSVFFSFQEGSPFIVCMTYAFQTPEKLCFILDLMNGGDLHYHLSQHGVFTEKEVKFYAAEVILGLEHMHSRYVVYRDLKVHCIVHVSNFELLFGSLMCEPFKS